ncbi:MAG: metallophosphoesterase [Clostridia bacterium]|nr:metallophosphoesterase [Clostridia bacterium]
MKQKGSFFLRLPVLIAAFVLMTAAASVYRAYRMVWVFYEPNIGFLGGSMGLFLIALGVLAVTLVLLALRLYRSSEKPLPKICAVLGGVAFVLSVLFAVAIVAIIYISGHETNQALLLYLKKDLPVILLFLAAVLSLLVLPNLRGKAKPVLAVLLAVCLALGALSLVFPLKPFRLVSDPVVMDTGEDYAVVFATSAQGTGFVEYNFDGTDYTVYAQIDGRRIGDRLIHSVHVPYTHLKNNRYKVGSTRVIEEYSYGSRLGKTVTSDTYTLSVNEGRAQTYLVISDWHTYVKQAKQAIFHLGEYDAVVMLGDPAPGMDFEEEAVEYIVRFGGDLTGGEIPVIYVRGNHETRGAFADQLPSYLGYDKLYYTVDRGPYSFLVLDSGEDKNDDHVEYGGMDDYRVNREEMVNWLEKAEVKTDKLIVLSHAWQVSEPEPELSRKAWDAFSALGARFVVSGHMHVCRFLSEENEQEKAYLDAYPDITTYIDGGHRGDSYIASKLTLTQSGARFEAVNQNGEVVVDETFPW